jgi:exodeoxyribonuclease VII small subunit
MASEEPSFEELYHRLEEVVARLEAGGLGLEEALGLYEEGMRLARRCQEMLNAAELRITRLRDELGLYTGEGATLPQEDWGD